MSDRVDIALTVNGELRQLVVGSSAVSGLEIEHWQQIAGPHPGAGHLDEVVGLIRGPAI